MHAHIGIIGGGMGGLLLARALAEQGVASTVFEREAGPGLRAQGGSLDLHPESGQRALRIAGLEEGFWKLARKGGEELRVYNSSGQQLAHRIPDEGADTAGRPEIDRPALRDMLRESVPEGTIRWGHHLVEISPRTNGGFTLRFDGTEDVTCDLLIGADGARSLIRPLLTDAKPSFAYSYVEMHITDVDQRSPEISELVGEGTLWAFGDSMNFGAQRNGDGGMRVSLSVPGEEDWMENHGIRANDPEGSRAALHEVLAQWSPTLTDILDVTDDYVVPRPITTLPKDVGWEHHPDVTMLGDAAHLAPPAGEGANQALLDGALLAQSLLSHGVASDGSMNAQQRAAAIADYEDEMFPRATNAVEHSLQMISIALAPNAAETTAKMFA